MGGNKIADGIQRPRRDQGESRVGIKAKERPTFENRGWGTLPDFLVFGGLRSAARQWNNSDQIDQTYRCFLGFGLLSWAACQTKDRAVKEGICASKVKSWFPTKYCNPCETARIIRL